MVDYKIFDRDKFPVVGTPNITDDGIFNASLQANNYVKMPALSTFTDDSYRSIVLKIRIKMNKDFIPTSQTGIVAGRFWASYETTKGQIGLRAQAPNNIWLFSVPATLDGEWIDIIWEANTDGIRGGYKTIDVNTYTYGNYVQGRLSLNNDFILFPNIKQDMSIGQIDLKQVSITVDDVEVFNGSHLANVAEKIQYLKVSKEIIRQSIEAKGVEVPVETPFRQYADKIGEISGGGGGGIEYKKVFYPPDANSYNLTEDGILICDGSVNKTNKAITHLGNTVGRLSYVVEMKFKPTVLNRTSPSIICGGQVARTFCIGWGANTDTPYLGIWAVFANNSSLMGDGDSGRTTYRIEANKDYWLRFTQNAIAYNNFDYLLEIKDSRDAEYETVFHHHINYGLYESGLNQIWFGGAAYGDIFSFAGEVDLKECAAYTTYTNGSIVVKVGG